MPFADCVLAQPQSWCVQNMALLTKSRLEKERMRTLERSTTQLSVCSAPALRRVTAAATRRLCLYATVSHEAQALFITWSERAISPISAT